jgi:tRNA dimethylallyltransferase
VAAIDPGVFVLDLPRETLTARIEARVDTMIATGLVDEVRALLAAGYDERSPGMSATGYIELIPWIRGEYSLQQAIELIRSATRQYARRQRTWLRHQLPANAVRLDAVAPADELADRIAALWRAESM